MGSDIHLYVEYRPLNSTDKFKSFGGRINPGRSYNLFGMLAGVRGGTPKYAPRGLPDDLGWYSQCDSVLSIIDDGSNEESGTVHESTAAKWVAQGSSKYAPGNGSVTHPDWHTHSWLTCDEFADVVEKPAENWKQHKYLAIIAAMKSFQKFGNEVRVVFWFDC